MESERQKSHALLQHFAAEKCKVFVCCCCCVYSIHVFETLFAAGVLILRLVSYNTALLPLMLLLRCFCCLFGVCARLFSHQISLYKFPTKTFDLRWGEHKYHITFFFWALWFYAVYVVGWLVGWCLCLHAHLLTMSICRWWWQWRWRWQHNVSIWIVLPHTQTQTHTKCHLKN